MTRIRALLSGFTHVPRTLRLVWASSPRMTAGLLGLTVLAAVLPIAVAWAGKWVVDAVVAADPAMAVRRVGLELLLVTLMAATSRGLSLSWQLLGSRLSVDVNRMILAKARTLELRHFEDPEFYDQLTKARREASSRPLGVVTDTFGLLQNVLGFLGYGGLLIGFSPLAVLGLLVASIPAAAVEMQFGKSAYRLRNWRAPETRKLAYLEYVLGTDTHAKEVMLFGLGPLFLGRYSDLAEQFYREDRSLAVKRTGSAFALSLLATAAFYGCSAWMAWQAASGLLTIGQLTLYVVAFRQGQQSFQSLLGSINGIYEDNLYMSNLFQFLAIDVSANDRIDGDAFRDEKGIRFEGVGFKYPGSETWALRAIDLFVPAGQSLALVGHNGAGKTTFIKLLTRLYDPTEGRILLDGRDLRTWDKDALRKRIGVIFQDFNQYHLTARENVGVGSVEHVEDRDRVAKAVNRGGADAVIAGLKDGQETMLGRWFREGVELSCGQWQKVALARAWMREDADILVLDEPTAALDAEAEHAVFERFRELAHGRTTILISHRFPTVRMADRILVIEGGHVLEEGTHEQLVARGERYAQLFELQARGYL
jgi:ATP-binding cassette subfamily B protein